MVVLYLLVLRVQCCTCTGHGWFNEEKFHRKANYHGPCFSGVAFRTKDEAFSVRGGNLEGSADDYRPSHQSSPGQQRRVPVPPPPPPSLEGEGDKTQFNRNDSRIKRVDTRNGNEDESTTAATHTSVSNTSQQSLSRLVSEGKRSNERKTDISHARLDYEAKYYGNSRIRKESVHHMPTQYQQNASSDVVEKTNQTTISQKNISNSDVPDDDHNYNTTSFTAQHKDNTTVIPDDDEFDVHVNKVHTGANINTGTNVPVGASPSSANKPSNKTADDEPTHQKIHANPNISASVAEKEEVLEEASLESKTDAYDRFAANDEESDIAETSEHHDFDDIGSDSEDSEALSRLERSLLMKSKSQDSSNDSISSWLMTSMSKVGKRLVGTVISSIWAPSRQDEKNLDSDVFTPTLAATQMKMPRGLGSEVLVKQNQFIPLSISGPSPDAIWKTEQNVLNHAMELFSLYFGLWDIKCPNHRALSGKAAVGAKSAIASDITLNAPVPFQPGNLGTSLNHAESILVSTFLSNAVSSAILNDSIMNTILPAVYSHIDNYKAPIQPIRTKREKTVITKTTRARPTILSKIDTDEDLDDLDFVRLLMELEGGPNEQIVEEIEYEYDEEPLFIDADDVYEVEDQDPDIAVIPDVEIDDLNDEQVHEIERELDDGEDSEIDNDTDDDDLLDDNELEVLEDARIDSSDWFSGDDDVQDDILQ